MPSRLIRLTPFVPGEYPYEQRAAYQDGQWTGDILHSWSGGGFSIEQQARSNVLPFRQKNGIARASLAETVDDINLFTCARLGNNKRYCSDGSPQVNVQTSSGGGCCGAKI